MKIAISTHAMQRMQVYAICQEFVYETLLKPDAITDSYGGRKIYQKRLDGYVLWVIVEDGKEIKRVITVYKARSGRYEI